MKRVIITLTIFIAAFINVNQIHADETCDQAGESCCLVGYTYVCGGVDLVCNQVPDPNDNSSYINTCVDKNVAPDASKCNEVDEQCCQKYDSSCSNCQTTTRFCTNGLNCDAGKYYTCSADPLNNTDYTKCSASGNACCRGAFAGCANSPCNYCGPGLTMHESTTSCKCCTPGDDNCASVDLIPTFVLCNTVTGDQHQTCIDCLTNDKVWTGLGCISFDPKNFITDFLKLAMGIAGGIALLLMVYGSFLISTSAGDPKKAEEGKEVITGTIAGLLFIIFSVVLLRLIGVDILSIPGL